MKKEEAKSLKDQSLDQVTGGNGDREGKWCKYCNNWTSQDFLGTGTGYGTDGAPQQCNLYKCRSCGNTNYWSKWGWNILL